MCGRYTLVETDKLQKRFQTINTIDDLKPNYNVAPTQDMPVVIEEDGERVVKRMKWGLVPSWSKTPTTKFSTINARSEGLEDKPMYRGPFKHRRGIVPANGYIEWLKEGKEKQPYLLQLKDGELYGFAGLYDIWTAPDGEEHYTYTIVTASPNKLVERFHDREAVILYKNNEDAWLSNEITEPTVLHGLLKSRPENEMEAFPISVEIGKISNNSAELLKPINV